MKTKHLLYIILTLFSVHVFAQELPRVIPPSPNTASIGKYGDIPIGFFTGSPQVSIPLFEYTTSNLSVPISIRYSSNGVRVDEYSSHVGMGWDLSAGGVITRRVNDDPDEHTQVTMPDPNTQLYTQAMLSFLEGQSADNGSPGSADYQPDLFTFSFQGFSGSFYLDTNSANITQRTPILLEPSPLKIEVSGSSGNLQGFDITAPDGKIYTFGGSNGREESMSRSSCAPPPDEPDYRVPNAWHLTSITHPEGDVIEFVYSKKTLTFDNGISQNVTREDAFNSGTCSSVSDTPCVNTSTNTVLYLTEINGNGLGKVTFTYSQKSGMPANMEKLDKVSLLDNNNNPIKEYELDYVSYTNTGSTLVQAALIQTYHSKRFFLDQVTEKGSNGVAIPPYKFEYYTPQSLPSRFSGAQDYWGYHNGASTNGNLIDDKTVEYASGNPILANGLSNFAAADREPNFVYGIHGLLKKVTYPTGGFNELLYEGHSYRGTQTVYPALVTQTATAHNITEGETTIDEFTTPVITFNHDADIDFLVDMILVGSGNTGPSTNPYNYDVQIIDENTGQFANLYERVNYTDQPRANPFNVTMENSAKDYFVRLEAGHSYKVRLLITRGDTEGSVKLYHYPSGPTEQPINIEVGGGRIATVLTNDSKGNVHRKNYHYGDLSDLTASSGHVLNRNSDPWIVQNERVTNNPFGEGFAVTCSTSTLSSNSAFPIYGFYHIGYESVVEENDVDFNAGGTYHKFNTIRLGATPNLGILGSNIPGTPLPNFFRFGNPLETSVVKKNGSSFITLAKTEWNYSHDPSLDDVITIYNLRKKKTLETNEGNFTNVITEVDRFEITSYLLKTQWHNLGTLTQTTFDENGLNPQVSTTDYTYGNPTHMQVTKEEMTDSKGQTITTEYYYPDDVSTISSLGAPDLSSSEKGAIDRLKRNDLNRPVEIVQKEVKVLDANQNVLSRSLNRTEFEEYGSKVRPQYQNFMKGNHSANNPLERRITFKEYGNLGKPLEVSQEGGISISYIWGYNGMYPIAKIDNASYSEIAAALGISVAILKTYDEGNMTAINGLRNSLSKAMVTTYIYDPLVGMTSMTDPRGYTTYYEYDALNRLKSVKDADGNYITDHNYHYSGQQ